MPLAFSILADPQDIQRLTAFLDGMSKRAIRQALVPILIEGLEPLVDREKEYLAPHSKSGALAAGLVARAGSGDRAGSISVFSAPLATRAQLESTWRGPGARRQQRGWAIKERGRTRVFYGPIVHQGHRIVKRNAAGELFDTGKVTQPVPFAQQAVDSMGDEQAEATAVKVLEQIMGPQTNG